MDTGLPAETAFAIDFNLHQVPAALGLPVPPAAGAAMLGIDKPQFLAYAQSIRDELDLAAAGLMAHPDTVNGLAALRSLLAPRSASGGPPQGPPQGVVLAAGDSITTYRRGYAEMLRALLARCYPEDRLRLLNVAQSGYTSTHLLEVTYTQWLAQQPDLVFLMVGANDCKRFGSPSARTLVPAAAYAANLAAIVEAFQTHTTARLVLMTPPPVVESLTNTLPEFASVHITWDNRDIASCAAAVRDLAGRYALACIDLNAAFGSQPDAALYLPDGLHPGPVGHRLILNVILQYLHRRNA